MRFAIRDVLWLTVIVGLAVAWRLETKQRQRGLGTLKRIQPIAAEQEKELDGVELHVLGSNDPSLPTLARWAKRRRKKRQQEEALAGKYDPDKALVGEWEVVGMIFKGTVQDFGDGPGGWMKFGGGKWSEAAPNRRYVFECDYTIVEPGKIDIDMKGLLGRSGPILKCLYEHQKDGTLHMAWGDNFDDRPAHFDALDDSRLKLYVLQKAK